MVQGGNNYNEEDIPFTQQEVCKKTEIMSLECKPSLPCDGQSSCWSGLFLVRHEATSYTCHHGHHMSSLFSREPASSWISTPLYLGDFHIENLLLCEQLTFDK